MLQHLVQILVCRHRSGLLLRRRRQRPRGCGHWLWMRRQAWQRRRLGGRRNAGGCAWSPGRRQLHRGGAEGRGPQWGGCLAASRRQAATDGWQGQVPRQRGRLGPRSHDLLLEVLQFQASSRSREGAEEAMQIVRPDLNARSSKGSLELLWPHVAEHGAVALVLERLHEPHTGKLPLQSREDVANVCAAPLRLQKLLEVAIGSVAGALGLIVRREGCEGQRGPAVRGIEAESLQARAELLLRHGAERGGAGEDLQGILERHRAPAEVV
mmetsp:Transcript_60957/g.189016  ORF Transcript_60957/g.189016 Transcript_60957/m.189016 type:complete len:268 (-) Transcript_60957:6-809(-)